MILYADVFCEYLINTFLKTNFKTQRNYAPRFNYITSSVVINYSQLKSVVMNIESIEI